MITLYMKNLDTEPKTQRPIKLVIEDREYMFGIDNIFEKLEEYIGYRIQVVHSGTRTDIKNYTIKEVLLNTSDGVPTLDLRD